MVWGKTKGRLMIIMVKVFFKIFYDFIGNSQPLVVYDRFNYLLKN